MSASRALTACTTSRELEPVNIMTVPATISPSPCLVTVPKRSAGPMRTSPRFLISTGVPSASDVTTVFSMSSTVWNCPSARMTNDSRFFSM